MNTFIFLTAMIKTEGWIAIIIAVLAAGGLGGLLRDYWSSETLKKDLEKIEKSNSDCTEALKVNEEKFKKRIKEVEDEYENTIKDLRLKQTELNKNLNIVTNNLNILVEKIILMNNLGIKDISVGVLLKNRDEQDKRKE